MKEQLTPQQQKAKELVEKFYKSQVKILNKEGCTEIESVELEIAKQCALIACENEHISNLKLIESLSDYLPSIIETQAIIDAKKEYQSVKQEITKL